MAEARDVQQDTTQVAEAPKKRPTRARKPAQAAAPKAEAPIAVAPVEPGETQPKTPAPRPLVLAAPSPALALDAGRPLTESIPALFESMIGRACEVADGASSDPAGAIHEFRKALRRAEAVIRLVQPALARRAYRNLRRGLAEALQGTATLRDMDVELETIAGLDLGEELRPTLDLLLARVARERDAQRASGEAVRLLAANRACVEGLPQALREALAAEVSWEELAGGLRGTYRAARRAWREAGRRPSDGRVHALRLRAKPVRYQLELLGDHWDATGGEVRQRMAELTKQLGVAADLIAVRRRLGAERRALAEGHPGRARRAVRALVLAQAEEALESAAHLLGKRARSFAEAVVVPLAAGQAGGGAA